jgi:hypothetical protein
MKQLSPRVIAPALVVALFAASLPAQAQYSVYRHPVASSVAVTSVVSLVVVTAPIWLTSAGIGKLHDGSVQRSRARVARAERAGPLPPLTVERIEPQADGGFQVALKNPDAPDDLALLQWPARSDTSAPAVAVGDVLAFEPTPAGAGWTVTAVDGAALAFLPTTDAAASNLSERW